MRAGKAVYRSRRPVPGATVGLVVKMLANLLNVHGHAPPADHEGRI